MIEVTSIVRFMTFDENDDEQDVRTIAIYSEIPADATVESYQTLVSPAVYAEKERYRQSIGEDAWVDAEILTVLDGHVNLHTFPIPF